MSHPIEQTFQTEHSNRWYRPMKEEPDPIAHAIWRRSIALAQSGQVQQAQSLCRQILTEAPKSRYALRLQMTSASTAAQAAFVGLIALLLTPSLIKLEHHAHP